MHDYVQIYCRNNMTMHGENFSLPRVCNDNDWAQFMSQVGHCMNFHCMRMFDQFGNEIKKENVWRCEMHGARSPCGCIGIISPHFMI
jgi:hypothetical protein